MAKLFGELEDERRIEVHKIANKQLCTRLYYGSHEHSIKAVTVCATIEPHIAGQEKAVVVAEFISPAGYPIHFHKEEYLMPKERILAKEVVAV